MKLKEIIECLPSKYNPEIEKILVKEVHALSATNLSVELADLLSIALSDGYNDLAKTILEKDYNGKTIELQNINRAIIDQSSEQYSLLHFAAQFGNKEMLLYFLENGVQISEDKDKLTPLHILTFAKNLEKKDIAEIIVKLEELSPGIINQRDAFFLTPLHYAAHNNNMQALGALIDNGAKRT